MSDYRVINVDKPCEKCSGSGHVWPAVKDNEVRWVNKTSEPPKCEECKGTGCELVPLEKLLNPIFGGVIP